MWQTLTQVVYRNLKQTNKQTNTQAETPLPSPPGSSVVPQLQFQVPPGVPAIHTVHKPPESVQVAAHVRHGGGHELLQVPVLCADDC